MDQRSKALLTPAIVLSVLLQWALRGQHDQSDHVVLPHCEWCLSPAENGSVDVDVQRAVGGKIQGKIKTDIYPDLKNRQFRFSWCKIEKDGILGAKCSLMQANAWPSIVY